MKFAMFSSNFEGYLKDHWTITRVVCTHLNEFLMLNSNMTSKIENFEFFWKSSKILFRSLHMTVACRKLNVQVWSAIKLPISTSVSVCIYTYILLTKAYMFEKFCRRSIFYEALAVLLGYVCDWRKERNCC